MQETIIKCGDNSGAQKLRFIRLYGRGKCRHASIGDVILCSIRTKRQVVGKKETYKKGQLVKALVISTKSPHVCRRTGMVTRFNENVAVLIEKSSKKGFELASSRVNSPALYETVSGFIEKHKSAFRKVI